MCNYNMLRGYYLVLFAALVPNMPLIYPVALFSIMRARKPETARAEPNPSPSVAAVPLVPCVFLQRVFLTLQGCSLVLSHVSLLVLGTFNHKEMFYSSAVPRAESSL